MAFFAKLDGLHSRKTAESWADDAEFGYRRRLPHNSSSFIFQTHTNPDFPYRFAIPPPPKVITVYNSTS